MVIKTFYLFILDNYICSNGKEWYRLRQSIIEILHLKTVHSYWSRQKLVAQDFAQNLVSYQAVGDSDDFLQYAFLYSLEGNYSILIFVNCESLPVFRFL